MIKDTTHFLVPLNIDALSSALSASPFALCLIHMPGKKSLKKMEKTQDTEAPKEEKKKEKIVGSVDAIHANSPELMDAMKKMKAITPTGVASQFNLKVSVAKKMLEELDQKGTIKLVAHTNNLRVYSLPPKNN